MTAKHQQDRVSLREQGDRLLRRATFLDPADRAIIESLYGSGMTAVQVSNLTSVTAGTIRRRSRQLVQHLGSPLFTFVLLERGKWSPTRRKIAECHFLRRHSLRETVQKTQCSLHTVRRESDAVRAQFEMALS